MGFVRVGKVLIVFGKVLIGFGRVVKVLIVW